MDLKIVEKPAGGNNNNTWKPLGQSGVGGVEEVRDLPEDKEVIISCENIHKTYLLGVEGVAALRGASVDVYRGELLVIYGTSGGGKSTLLNVLGTIDTPTKGNLAVLNSRITDQTEDAIMARLRCKNVGFVFQSFNLLGTMTAQENVALPMIIAGDMTSAEIKERAQSLLKDVGLGHRLDHLASHLSGGEQQRVTIARAMANNPDILLMDEPTGDLDSKNTELVMNILLTLNRTKQLTMVMVTHDVYMKQYADRVLYMRDGRVGRIETIADEIKHSAYAELQQKVLARFRGADLVKPSTEQQNVGGMKRTVRSRKDYATGEAHKSLSNLKSVGRGASSNLVKKLFPGAAAQEGAEQEMSERHYVPAAGTAQQQQRQQDRTLEEGRGANSASSTTNALLGRPAEEVRSEHSVGEAGGAEPASPAIPEKDKDIRNRPGTATSLNNSNGSKLRPGSEGQASFSDVDVANRLGSAGGANSTNSASNNQPLPVNSSSGGGVADDAPQRASVNSQIQENLPHQPVVHIEDGDL